MKLGTRNIPRWGIFCIDLLIAISAVIIAHLLRFNFNVPDSHIERMMLSIPLVIIVRAICSFIFETYSGIIYHTSVQDARRIFFSVTLGSFIFILTNFVSYSINEKYLFSRAVLIIDYVLCIFMMTAFRVFVKMLYLTIKDTTQEKINFIIYGAGESGIITKRTLDRDETANNQVVAFVEDDVKLIKKEIEGVKIYDIKNVEEIFNKKKIHRFIFAKTNIDKKTRKNISELCIQYAIQLLEIPPMVEWVNQELSVKQIKKIKIEDLLERDPIVLDKDNISQQLINKVVLITGAAGSIGSEIARQIIPFHPKKLILLDQAETPLYELDQELSKHPSFKNFEIVIGDVRNKERMSNVFNTFNPDYVYHAAAYKHVPLMENNPSEAILTNILGTKVIADLAVNHQVKKMVYVSTDKAVNPTNIMGAAKRIGEIYVQSLNNSLKGRKTKFITTRFGNVLDSNGSVIPLFRKQIETGGPVTVTHQDITRYFMTIPEACQLVLEAGAMGEGGEIFIFDMGKQIKIADLARKMIKLSGLVPDEDIKITYSGLRPGEKLHEELLDDQENNLSTHNPKILIAKVRIYEFEKILLEVDSLINQFKEQNNDHIVRLMKKIVPEFISQNSTYVMLDKPVAKQKL